MTTPWTRSGAGPAAVAALVGITACADRKASEPAVQPRRALPATPWKAAAIAHCGAGTLPSEGAGCSGAVAAALAALEAGRDPIDAAVSGVVVLEDDARYNAGTGSNVRLDGRTVQMDAAVMDSGGRYGAVAVIEGVKNPIRVARAVVDTPHRLIAGEGATAFARALGHAPWDPTTPGSLEEARALQGKLVAGDPTLPEAWRTFDWRRVWNFETPPPPPSSPSPSPKPGPDPDPASTDTVGVAVRSTDGRFAAALSTGGWTLMLRGRVGDAPLPGAGLYVGPAGAVAGTGRGERIIDVALARTVYGLLESGVSADDAARRGIELLGGEGGIIVITPTDSAAAAGKTMAWCARTAGGALEQP